MNTILIHGDNTQASFERLQKFILVAKKRGWEILRLSDSSLNLSEALTSTALFTQKRLFVLEELATVAKKELNWLKEKSQGLEGNLVIYHQGNLAVRLLKSLPKGTKVEEFKLPKLIWKFLDSFYPGNARAGLKLFHQVLDKEPIEFVLALLARHLRDVYWAKADAQSLPYPVWRISKLKKQATFFPQERLTEIIRDLADADIRSKTSDTSLRNSLDFLLISKLE